MDIQERWTLKDLLDAHEMLDLFERMEAREIAKLERDAKPHGARPSGLPRMSAVQ